MAMVVAAPWLVSNAVAEEKPAPMMLNVAAPGVMGPNGGTNP
jgi:hypothetical protein